MHGINPGPTGYLPCNPIDLRDHVEPHLGWAPCAGRHLTLQTSCTETARHYAHPHSNAAPDLPPSANTTAKIWVTRRQPCVMLARRDKATFTPAIPRSHPIPISPPICLLQDRNPSYSANQPHQAATAAGGGPRGGASSLCPSLILQP